MTQSRLILGAVLCLGLTASLWAEDAVNHPITWDENATAESLGLEPLTVPDDFYPLYTWDRIGWSGQFGQTEDEGLKMIADCAFPMPSFIGERNIQTCKDLGFRYVLLDLGIKGDLLTITDEQADQYVSEMVASTKDDPMVLGYYVTDEPGAKKFPGLAKIVAAIKKHAPGKLAYINLFPSYATTIGADVDSQMQTYSFTEYLERYVQEVKPQFISYDNYMVEYSEDMSDEGRANTYWRDILEVRRIAQKYELPWWNIVSSLSIREISSPPTISRTAFQAYTSLAAGANGLGWFLFYSVGDSNSSFDFGPIDKNHERTITWNFLRDINEQTLVLGKILNRFHSTNVWFSQPTDLLPANPGDLLKGVNIAYQEEIIDVAGTPSVMVGEFKAKEGTQKAVMVVNLDFGRSITASLDLKEAGTIQAVNPVTGSAYAPRQREWILPGHGLLFLID